MRTLNVVEAIGLLFAIVFWTVFISYVRQNRVSDCESNETLMFLEKDMRILLRKQIELIRRKNRPDFRGTMNFEENGKVISYLESPDPIPDFSGSSVDSLVRGANNLPEVAL